VAQGTCTMGVARTALVVACPFRPRIAPRERGARERERLFLHQEGAQPGDLRLGGVGARSFSRRPRRLVLRPLLDAQEPLPGRRVDEAEAPVLVARQEEPDRLAAKPPGVVGGDGLVLPVPKTKALKRRLQVVRLRIKEEVLRDLKLRAELPLASLVL